MNRLRLGPLLLLCTLWSACARNRPSEPGPRATRAASIARPLEVYQELGFIAGPPEFPAVASLATLAGPGDSTYVLFALSLPNSALRFRRDEAGFLGEYNIALTFLRDTVIARRIDRKENVRIGSFAETGRTDESIIFQEVVALTPGKYKIQLLAKDAYSSRALRARDSVEVPAYGRARRLSVPVLVYTASGRVGPEVAPDFIVNPRRTVPYGADLPHVYVELYEAAEPETVQLRVVDERGQSLWQEQSLIEKGNARLRYALIDIPAGALPLGRLYLEATSVGTSAEIIRSPLLVTISDQWMVANFDEVLRFINYIGFPAELDSLRSVTGAERRARWESFWSRRDPLPATALNEFREEFFQRVRFATEHFGESGRPGWDSDRGEVYIVLGIPDQVSERHIGREVGAVPNGIEWVFESAPGGRLQLLFLDRAGFGRYELTPQSESAFRAAAQRLKPRPGASYE